MQVVLKIFNEISDFGEKIKEGFDWYMDFLEEVYPKNVTFLFGKGC